MAGLWSGGVDALRTLVETVMAAVEVPVLVYFLVINTSYLLLIGLAAWDLVHHRRRAEHAGHDETVASQLAPGVSVIVPAYNEEAGIVTSVQAMLALRYPRHEVVVVDDGSTDGTSDRLRAAFDLVPVERELPTDVPTRAAVTEVLVPRSGRTRLVLVRKENSGRSDAVNVGINAASEPLVAMVDADSILDPDSLLGVAKPFADDPIRMVATGGAIRAANGCTVIDGRIVQIRMPGPWLARVQVVEYLRAFMLGRTGWSRFGALILISGAFGMFRRDVLVEVGGLDPDSIGEDFELVMRIHRSLTDQRPGLPRRVRRRAGLAGPRCPSPPGCCAASGGGGTAGSGRRCGTTAGCCRPAVRPGRPGGAAVLLGSSSCSPRCSSSPGSCWCPRARARRGQRAVRLRVPRRRLRLRDPRDAGGHDRRGVSFHQYDRWRDLAATLAASIWRTSATASSRRGGGSRAGGPGSRQEAGLGRDDPSGLRRASA